MGILEDMERQRQMLNAQALANKAQKDYENQATQAQSDLNAAQSKPMGGLESVLAGIGEKFSDWGNTIGNIGRTVIGGVTEPFRKAETNKITADDSARRNEIAKKYGYASYSDAANDTNASQDFWNEIKNASEETKQRLTEKTQRDQNALGNVRDIDLNTAKGQSLSAIGDLLQILGPAGNVLGGAVESVGNSYKATAGGTDADVWGGDNLGRTLGNAAIGGATAFIGDKVGGKLASKAPGNGLLSRAIHSNVGRGTIAGAAAGATGGGLYAGLNGGDVIGGALQGAQGGAMAGGTMAGTMGLIGSGIDRLNRKYNAEPQTPDIPTTKPIVDEVAEQYTKPATIETALQEAQTPTRRQIDVQYDDSGNGNVAVTDRAEFDRRYKADNYRTKAAQRTLAQFGNVDAPAKRSAKAIETAKFMNGLDLFKKGDIDYATETVTGRNGAIAQAVTKVAQDADPVKINFKNVSEGVQRGLATSSLTDAKKKAVATSINAYNDRLSSLANPDGTISPNDVLNTIRNVEGDAATLLGKDGSTYRRPTSTDTRMAHVLQDYARDLQDIVDDNVNIKGVITPELSAQLKNAQPGNQKWAEWVDKTLDGAKTVKDLRKAQAPFVRMARFAENAEAQSTNNLPTTKSAILNQAVAGIVNSNDALARRAQYNAKKADAVMASNSNGVKGKVGDVAKNIASKAGKAAEMLNNETLTGSALGRFAATAGNRRIGQGEAQAVENRAALQDATQQMQDIQSNYENSMLQAQQAYNQAQQTQNSIPSTLGRISAGMERALAAGDINAYSTLANLYKQAAQIYELQNPTATKSEAKALSANQSKALTGLQQLQTLANMTPDLGTALANSPLGGVVDMLGGNDYANQAKSLSLTLGYLQSGANITPREAENIGKSYIPTAYDSEQVRQQKLSRAEQLLRNYLADTSALQ